MQHKASDLTEWIIDGKAIECVNHCHAADCYFGDNIEEYFFNLGWRTTKHNIYCPECAKKKLKL